MVLSCTAPACACEPWREKHQEARKAFDEQRFFEAVQLINHALEAFDAVQDVVPKGQLITEPARVAEESREKLSDEQRGDVADLYATRADIMMNLGGLLRARTELEAALVLVPEHGRSVKLREECDVLEVAVTQAVQEQETTQASKKIPVHILTGFLGSGKTTLLNHVLNDMHGKKLAVIENEFGEIGIDDALIARRQDLGAEQIIEMNNGCVCCTVRGDLIRGLQNICRRTAEEGKQLDGVIIETTGLADPAPVAQTFFANDYIQSRMVLDGIITVVDAKHVLQHLREVKPEGVENEAVEQVAFADRILLNKTDLVTEEVLVEVEASIREINQVAPIYRTQQSRIALDEIVGIRSFSLDKVLELDGEFLRDEQDHQHDSSVTSLGIECDGDCDHERLNTWVATLLKEKGVDIFRMKGVLSIKGSNSRFVFQGIHMIFGGQPQEEWAEGEKRLNRMVFIGRNLDRGELINGFMSTLDATR